MRYTKSSLKKIETFLQDRGYTIRYEKGNFTSGYCIVHSKKMIIINKFFKTKARIQNLLNVIQLTGLEEDFGSLMPTYHRRDSLSSALVV